MHRVWQPAVFDHSRCGLILHCSIPDVHCGWDHHLVFGSRARQSRPYYCNWGDGSAITEQEVTFIGRAYGACCVRMQLAAGELVVVDNTRVSHGREPFSDRDDGDGQKERRQLGLLLGPMRDRVPGLSW